MKLPLSLILDCLSDSGIEFAGSFQNEQDLLLVSRPFFSAESPHGLILEGDTLNVVIKTGSDEVDEPSSCQYVAIHSKAAPEILANALHALFNKWEQWLQALFSMALRDAELSEYLEITEKLTGNPGEIMGAEYLLIAFSDGFKRLLKEDGYKEYNDLQRGQLLPLTVVDAIKNFIETIEKEHRPDIFFYNENPLPARSVIASNIYHKDTLVANIVLYEDQKPLRPWHRFVLQILTDILSPQYFEQSVRYTKETHKSADIVTLLLTEGSINQRDRMDLYGLTGWNDSTELVVAVLSLLSGDMQSHNAQYYSRYLRNTLPGSVPVFYQRQLMVLTKLESDPGKTCINSFAEKLSDLIGRDIVIGISNRFSNLSATVSAYRQAATALHYGLKTDPSLRYHLFSDHAFEYILDNSCTDMDVCAPHLYALKQYDDAHGSQLYETLRCYLINNQNSVRTAKELFIQRNTLLYRLRKIQQLTDIRFDDYSLIQYISISFQIEEKRKRDNKL